MSVIADIFPGLCPSMSVSSVAMTWSSVKLENYTPDRERDREGRERNVTRIRMPKRYKCREQSTTTEEGIYIIKDIPMYTQWSKLQ
jgi:hypothetical protein